MKSISKIFITLMVTVLSAPTAFAQDVFKYSGPADQLESRWDWATQEARRMGEDVWIGYSIERLMGERSYMTSGYNSRWKNRVSLYEIIEGVRDTGREDRSDDETLSDAAQDALDHQRGRHTVQRKVLKDLAILFLVDGRSGTVEEVNINNMELHYDLEGNSLLWLGESNNTESLPFLHHQYENVRPIDIKEDLVTAIGVHDDSDVVVPILSQILDSRVNNEVREQAAFWLGQQDDEEALDILIRTARNDRSEDVREHAVFAISQMDFPAATDTLIDLARNANDREIQKTAIFWLGQQASEKAVAALGDVIQDSRDTELQEQAVFAISQLPGDQAVPMLIEIAKTHRSGEVREKAIFWLGQTGDPRAVDTLVEIIKGQ